MIRFKCPHCQKDAAAKPENAGKKARCPACQQIFTIPAGDAAAAPAPARPAPAPGPRPAEEDVPTLDFATEEEERPARPKRQESRPIRRGRDEDEDEEEEEEEEDRPRRRKGGRRRPGQQWADCPNCGAPGDATR